MSLLRQCASTFASRTAMRVLGVGCGIVITRSLGPADKGLYVYVASVLGVILQCSFGEAAAISWQWGKLKLPISAIYSASAVVAIVFAVPVMAALALTAWLRPEQWVLYAAVAALPFGLIVQLSSGFFLTANQVNVVNVQAFLTQTVAALAAAAGLTIWHGNLTMVLAVWVAAQVAGAAYSLLRLRTIVPLGHFVDPRERLREHAGFSLRAGGLQLVTYANGRIDLFIVMAFLGPRALGIYSVAIGLSEMLWLLTKSLSLAAFGRITSRDHGEAARLTLRCILYVSAFALVAGVAGWFAVPTLVVLAFGKPFADAAIAFRYLVPGAVVWSTIDLVIVYFSTQRGRPDFGIAIQFGAAAFCAFVALVLTPRIGIVGAALATSSAYALAGSLALVSFVRSAGLTAGDALAILRNDWRSLERLLGARFVRPSIR